MKKPGAPFLEITMGDISFFILRLAIIPGGIAWLSLAAISQDEARSSS
jgi:hypothetical protein